RPGALSDAQVTLRTHYAEALAAYRARRFDEARAAFNAALEAVPGDGPSRAMLGRIAEFEANPPAGDWDGGWRLEQK
ncbi:tetratricopeptide repeat protein, partial [Bradyrhizobium sp.]|uniref:tetratricopeptide repeat protein n=1 Tax=Bradyrhizobium sp. TaxID=376 RepID=UPI0025C42CE7